MAAREALYSLLDSDQGLQDLGFGAVYASNAVDTPPEARFIVVAWGVSTAAYKTVGRDRVSVWLHDREPDYAAINAGLARVRTLLTSVVHETAPGGESLAVVEWDGESQDLSDTGYGTVTRYADFMAVSRYASA